MSHEYGYTPKTYKLSDIITASLPLLGDAAPNVGVGINRIVGLQQAGNALRRRFGNDYLAAKTIERIAQWRDAEGTSKSAGGEPVPANKRYVHLIDSLKNPAELQLLRETYGDMFWLLGVFAPEQIRRQRLTQQKGFNADELAIAVRNDYNEKEPHGQSVRDTFHQADLFIRNDQPNDGSLRELLIRYLSILFGSSVQTPTLDEASMYAAYAQAAGSACMSRQVGAAVVSDQGEIIGLGRNDVPKFNGGLYVVEDGNGDHRCFRWANKICHNDDRKAKLYEDIWDALSSAGLLATSVDKARAVQAISNTEVRSLIEFSRAVHAEMEAIISVARGNKSGLVASTMYCTTYPCHSCARHILAAGIEQVIYIEPYPKSLAMALHYDAVSESENDRGKKLVFLQYCGVAPKHMLKLFKTDNARKTTSGVAVVIDKKVAKPLLAVSLDDYATHEKYVVLRVSENEKQAGGNPQAKLV